MISLIVAMDSDGVIGAEGAIPWDLPEDRAYFRRTTLGHPVIMGRRTFESIGAPLQGRQNILMSRNPSYRAEGTQVVKSATAALAAVAGAREAFVLGGAEIYEVFLPLATRLYITHVDVKVAGDTRFPEVRWEEWRRTEETPGTGSDPSIRFGVYERVASEGASR